MQRYILTGAPGCGKTSIIRALAGLGFSVVEEAATDVIAEAQAAGVEEPWTDPDFIERIADRQKTDLERVLREAERPTFFDRSPVCTHALCRYLGYAIPSSLESLLRRIHEMEQFDRRIFFIENLGFVERTAARRISFEDSLRFERFHLESYGRFGFELVRVPAATVEERVEVILGSLDA